MVFPCEPETGLIQTEIGTGFAIGPVLESAVGAVAAARSGTAAALISVACMVDETVRSIVLGAVFAIICGGIDDLRTAMSVGGAIQMGVLVWLVSRCGAVDPCDCGGARRAGAYGTALVPRMAGNGASAQKPHCPLLGRSAFGVSENLAEVAQAGEPDRVSGLCH